MPRPTRCRRIAQLPTYRSFSPDETEPSEDVILNIDEYEALRLLDGGNLTQEECAFRMNVSRTTVIAGNTTATATDNRPLFLKYQLY